MSNGYACPECKAELQNPFFHCLSAECVAARATNHMLLMFARHWRLDGDLIRCRHCQSGCLSSYAHKKFAHKSGCEGEKQVHHPWYALRDLVLSIQVK